jgi:hypothetical protein
MSEGEREAFDDLLRRDEADRRRKHEIAAAKLSQADEYEALHLYGKDGNQKGNGDS